MTRIRDMRKAAGMSMKELGKKVGVSESAIGYYETGKRKPSIEMLLMLAEALGCQMADLVSDVAPAAHQSEIDRKYNALDEHGKKVVSSVLDLEYLRCVGKEDAKQVAKIIPLFPAAAGPGEPVDGEVFDEYEAPADSKATFAVRISGDSMEPHFTDGEVVLCERRRPKDGEIAVVMVNGFLVVKQFFLDYSGTVHLLSLNRVRSSLDVVIPHDSTDTVTIWGVVMHKKIQPVQI